MNACLKEGYALRFVINKSSTENQILRVEFHSVSYTVKFCIVYFEEGTQ